jgi:predicted O-methyltransferase YrrM
VSPRLLSVGLRAMALTQRRPAGAAGDALARALRLRLSGAEADAEAAIDSLRSDLERDERLVYVEDHGAGTRGLMLSETKPRARRVADVYRRAAARPAWGRLLFSLVRELRPQRVLELGTSLGVSAAHLASALALNEVEGFGAGRLLTIEGDPGVAELARGHLGDLALGDRVDVVTGVFADALPRILVERGPFDLVFVDGHHDEVATLAYWRMLRPHLAPGACVGFDDIEPGRPVRRAWRRIIAAERGEGAGAVDLVGLGLLFLRPEGAPDPVAASDLWAAPVGQ